MAKLPPIRRLLIQDFVSQSSWIGPMLQIINNFMDGVYNSLNQSLTLQDNSTGASMPVVLTALPTSTSPVRIAWTKPSAPNAILIGNIQQRTVSAANSLTTSGTVITAAPGLEWQYVTNDKGAWIELTNVVGIPTPSVKVTITLQLIVFTG